MLGSVQPATVTFFGAPRLAPLVGDPLYATGGLPISQARPGDCGYFLHARSLRLEHPGGGRLVLRAPLPRWATD